MNKNGRIDLNLKKGLTLFVLINTFAVIFLYESYLQERILPDFYYKEFLTTLLSVGASVSLLGTSLISLGLEKNRDRFLGINVSEFVTRIKPKSLSMQTIINLQLIIVTSSMIFYIFMERYLFTIIFLFIISVTLIWLLISMIFKLQFESELIEEEIKNYLFNIFIKEDIKKDKKRLLINLNKYYEESAKKNSIEDILYTQEFFYNMISSVEFEKIDDSKKSIIFESYFELCRIGIRSKKSDIFFNQLIFLQKFMTKDSNLLLNFEFYYYFKYELFPNMKNINPSDFYEHKISFSLMHEWFINSYLRCKEEDRHREDYYTLITYFYAFLFDSLPSMSESDRKIFIEQNFQHMEMSISNEAYMNEVDQLLVRSLEITYKGLIDNGEYELFTRIIKPSMEEAFNMYSSYKNKLKPIYVVVIAYLIKLYSVDQLTEKDTAVQLAKKFLFEEKSFLKHILNEIYNPFEILVGCNFTNKESIHWSVTKEKRRNVIEFVGAEINLYIFSFQLFLVAIGIGSNQSLKDNMKKIISNNRDLDNNIDSEEIYKFYKKFEKILGIDNNLIDHKLIMIKQAYLEIQNDYFIKTSINLNRVNLKEELRDLNFTKENNCDGVGIINLSFDYFEYSENWNLEKIKKAIKKEITTVENLYGREVITCNVGYHSNYLKYKNKLDKFFSKDEKTNLYYFFNIYKRSRYEFTENESKLIVATRFICIDLKLKI